MLESAPGGPAAPVPLAIIAAVARNGVIGDGRGLPWHLPSDLKHFRAITMGKPVLMGRKTLDTIGRALPGRETIVITRNRGYEPPSAGSRGGHIHIAFCCEAALDLAQARAKALGAGEIILAGGASLYESLIARAGRMHLTLVDLAPEGNVRFPAVNWAEWVETGRLHPPPSGGDEAPFVFAEFVRRRSSL
ncbi:MAG: dihydrofolate reductase [Methylocapsa sp.]|nr:dihydrofolate reductase [Methylocapsa sp.]